MYDTLIERPLTQSHRRCMQLSWLFSVAYARKCGRTQVCDRVWIMCGSCVIMCHWNPVGSSPSFTVLYGALPRVPVTASNEQNDPFYFIQMRHANLYYILITMLVRNGIGDLRFECMLRKGPFNYYVTLFLTNFDPPPPVTKCHTGPNPPPPP